MDGWINSDLFIYFILFYFIFFWGGGVRKPHLYVPPVLLSYKIWKWLHTTVKDL